MFSLLTLVLIYLLGGLTLLPLLLFLAILFLPKHTVPTEYPPDPIENDSNPLTKQFQRNHELDVAAGYFAVCREYVPGGQNGKPPERTTPAGEVITEESPSVYQSMYRSIFDRKQGPTLDTSKANGKPVKKANNVFYIVLRHHHLMLFDSIEQIVVRHVVSLNHHDVSIYGGGNEIPEGELWIRRNAICLTRKPSVGDVTSTSKPFYLFSENCSEKEDFYFALLHSQERLPGDSVSPPRPQQFELKDIISLVQKLHSSDEHLQTRWINAFIGRVFLALYKTQDVEDYIRLKITKKIARVKKPPFLSGILLQKIDMGQSAPYIINPRLKDLTVDGECCAEADFKYSGNFRLEIAATARIDLGTRFKAREVNLVLAVVIKKLEGHAFVRLKPPPSNRLWFSFEKMPHIEMHIEPIVSSRQITYSIILRAIESRIREVISETLVMPHWDDSPFTDTVHQQFRGGIWLKEEPNSGSLPTLDRNPDVEGEFDTRRTNSEASRSPALLEQDERSSSMTSLLDPPSSGLTAGLKKGSKSSSPLVDHLDTGVSTGVQKKPEMPKAIRTLSSASSGTATPVLSTQNANTEVSTAEFKAKQQKFSATSAMIALSNKSQSTSPTITPVGSSPQPQSFSLGDKSGIHSSSSSSIDEKEEETTSLVTSTREEPSTQTGSNDSSSPPSPKGTGLSRSVSDTFSLAASTPRSSLTSQQPLNASDKGKALATIGATAIAARKWGWSVINRNINEQKISGNKSKTDRAGLPDQPMGRGRPIPFANPVTMPKRKALPPRLPSNIHRQALVSEVSEAIAPPLPRRRKPGAPNNTNGDSDGLLVVEAPPASEPTSPSSAQEEFVYQMKINSEYGEELEEEEEDLPASVAMARSELDDDDLNSSRRSRIGHSKTPLDEGEHHVLPSWTTAQKQRRAQSIWAEESSLS